MGSTEKLYNNEEYKINQKALVTLLKNKKGLDSNDAFMLLVLSQITRAADAMEDIASRLSVISGCVEETDPLTGNRLCIKR